MALEYEIWQGHWQLLFKKLEVEGYESLSTDERIWYNVRGVIDSINDGGIISFYYNHGADTLDDTIEDLKKLKDTNVIRLLTKVNDLFPNRNPPQDIDERNEVIDSWDGENEELFETLDEKFSQLETELETKLEAVVRRIIQE